MLKTLIYDWYGLNKEIFSMIYSFTNSVPKLMDFLVLFTETANYKNIFLLINLAMIGNLMIIRREQKFFKKEIYVRYFIMPYVQKFLFIFATYITTLILTFIIKKVFAYQRPICLGLTEINYIEKGFNSVKEFFIERCYGDGSFPSAHAAISTIVALYCLELIDKSYLKLILLIYVLLIAVSRISLGLHYPMDVITGIIVGFLTYTGCAYFCESINKKYYDQMKDISERFLVL